MRVVDTINPILTCIDVVFWNGKVINIDQVANYTDNCNISSISHNITENTGNSTLTIVVMDSSGNKYVCSLY